MADGILETGITLVNDKVRFETTGPENIITIDSPPPYGDGAGHTSMNLFLTSLASCAATSLLTLMRDRMRKTITGMTVHASGTLKDEHPKSFSKIRMEITLISPDATEKEVLRALDSVEKKICPVWAMIKGHVHVETAIELKREPAGT